MNDLENTNDIYDKIADLIQTTQNTISKTINSAMVTLYWQVGKTIQENIVKNTKPEYGEQVIQTLATQLTKE